MTVKEIEVDVISRRLKSLLLYMVLLSIIVAMFVLWVTYSCCTETMRQLREVSSEACLIYSNTVVRQIVMWPVYALLLLLVLVIVMCIKSHECKNLLRNRKDAKLSWDYHYNTFVLHNQSKSIKFRAAFSVSDSVNKYTIVVQNFKVTMLIPLCLLPEFKELFDGVSER